MKNIQKWIDEKLEDISNKIPQSVSDFASFRTGLLMGYKNALVDLETQLTKPLSLDDIREATNLHGGCL